MSLIMRKTIGLDIGSHSIKLVGLKTTSKGPFLTHVGIKQIPYGGEKEDPTFISEIVKALFREVGLKPGKVKLTLSGSGVHIRRIVIPSMPKAELREAVRWEMKNHLPYPIESAKIDFQVLEQFAEKDSKKLDLIAVACQNHYIDRILSVAERAGMKPVHLSVGPFAFWNVLLALDQLKKEEVAAFIDLGAEKTGIYLFKDGILQFSREVTPAGMDLTRAIMDGMSSQEEPNLVYERSEKIKYEIGILSKAFYEKSGNHSTDLSKIPFLVRPVVERLTAEIGRSLDYYRSQFSIERIDRLLLSGGGANLKNIDTYLSEEIRLPVERFNPLKKIPFDEKKIDTQLLDQMGPAFTAAAGVSLPESKRIELLPPKEHFWSKARMLELVPRLSVLITLLVFSLIVWNMSGRVSALKKDRDEKMAKVKTLEMLQARLNMLKERENHIKQDLSLLPSSVIAPVPFRQALRAVSRIVPKNVTVTLLSIQDKAKPTKEESQTNRRELQITGLAFGSDQQCLTALVQMIKGLETSSLFKNAKLVSAEENKSYNQPGIGFEIVCDFNLDNPPSPPSVSSRTDFNKGELGDLKRKNNNP
jgi:type IV pilus assembly protein PilM